MKPERASALVARWVHFYTRDLPLAAGQRRIEEIAADTRDHIAHDRDVGVSDARISFAVMSRLVRGMPDDIAWRQRLQPSKGALLKIFVTGLVIALGLAALALYLDSALVVLLSVAVIAIDVVGVFVLGLRSAQRGDFVVPYFAVLVGALGVGAVGCAAIVWGSRDDAPGLVLLGGMLVVSVIVGAFAIGIRTAQSSR